MKIINQFISWSSFAVCSVSEVISRDDFSFQTWKHQKTNENHQSIHKLGLLLLFAVFQRSFREMISLSKHGNIRKRMKIINQFTSWVFFCCLQCFRGHFEKLFCFSFDVCSVSEVISRNCLPLCLLSSVEEVSDERNERQ